ncbi:MAG: hypothetical protein V4547_17205 [Bacteroidota bacterium]
MKQEFEMTQAEMDDIIAINKSQMPVLKIGNVITGMDLQERINAYWEGLGDKYGFKPLTVEGSARGNLFFLAEPKPIVMPKTETEKQIDKYLEGTDGYVSGAVQESLRKIVLQLESCNYETEAGCLNNNIAFLALKKLSQ